MCKVDFSHLELSSFSIGSIVGWNHGRLLHKPAEVRQQDLFEVESGFVNGLEKPLCESPQLLRRRLTLLLQPHILLLQLVHLTIHFNLIPPQKQKGSTCASSSPRSLLSPASSSSSPATLSSRARTSSSRVLSPPTESSPTAVFSTAGTGEEL